MLKLSKHPAIAIIEQRDYKRMPWKNGLGETREITKYSDDTGLRFRISQAAVVEDGEFSNFAGLHRTLVLLTGNGMRLSHKNCSTNQTEHNLESPLDIAHFAGGDQTVATLTDGSIEDLNIMVRETDTKANVTSYTAPCTIEITTNEAILFEGFYTNQECTFAMKEETTGSERLTLDTQSLMYFKTNTMMTLVSGSGVFIQVLSSSQ